jgi:ribosomal protein S25
VRKQPHKPNPLPPEGDTGKKKKRKIHKDPIHKLLEAHMNTDPDNPYDFKDVHRRKGKHNEKSLIPFIRVPGRTRVVGETVVWSTAGEPIMHGHHNVGTAYAPQLVEYIGFRGDVKKDATFRAAAEMLHARQWTSVSFLDKTSPEMKKKAAYGIMEVNLRHIENSIKDGSEPRFMRIEGYTFSAEAKEKLLKGKSADIRAAFERGLLNQSARIEPHGMVGKDTTAIAPKTGKARTAPASRMSSPAAALGAAGAAAPRSRWFRRAARWLRDRARSEGKSPKAAASTTPVPVAVTTAPVASAPAEPTPPPVTPTPAPVVADSLPDLPSSTEDKKDAFIRGKAAVARKKAERLADEAEKARETALVPWRPHDFVMASKEDRSGTSQKDEAARRAAFKAEVEKTRQERLAAEAEKSRGTALTVSGPQDVLAPSAALTKTFGDNGAQKLLTSGKEGGTAPALPEITDAIYDNVVAHVQQQGTGTRQDLQDKFVIGETRAKNIMRQMEQHGIIKAGSKGEWQSTVKPKFDGAAAQPEPSTALAVIGPRDLVVPTSPGQQPALGDGGKGAGTRLLGPSNPSAPV